MKFASTKLSEVFLIELGQPFKDARGFFIETYRKNEFEQHGIRVDFVQDNLSCSSKGTLRGLHYQVEPKAQAKLIRVVSGEIFDVVVDIRPDSKTFGKWEGHTLSPENRMMLFVPAGFAHGFLAMKDDSKVLYKVSDVYSPEHERGLIWNDPALGIDWPKLDTPYLLSEKDKKFPKLKEIQA